MIDDGIPRRQPEDLRCDNCANRAHFNVTVEHSNVPGFAARLACSRLCAEIVARRAKEQISATAPGWGAFKVSVGAMLT